MPKILSNKLIPLKVIFKNVSDKGTATISESKACFKYFLNM